MSILREKRYIKNNYRVNSDINIVPFMDIMLVLLIVFMISAPLLNYGIPLVLPNEKGDMLGKLDQDIKVVISIDKGLNYGFSLGEKQDNKVYSLSEIKNKVQKIIVEKPNIIVYLRADKNLEYNYIANFIASMREDGVKYIYLVMEF